MTRGLLDEPARRERVHQRDAGARPRSPRRTSSTGRWRGTSAARRAAGRRDARFGRRGHRCAGEGVVGLGDLHALRSPGRAAGEHHRGAVVGTPSAPSETSPIGRGAPSQLEVGVVLVDLDDPRSRPARRRWPRGRRRRAASRRVPPTGPYGHVLPSSAAVLIGSDGTIHAPRRSAASQAATNVGELVSARWTAAPGPAPSSTSRRATRRRRVELAVGPVGHRAVGRLEDEERCVAACPDDYAAKRGERHGFGPDRAIYFAGSP